MEHSSIIFFKRTGIEVLDFEVPFGITIDTVGNLYVSDTGNNRIVVY